MYRKLIEVDQCSNCKGMWLDYGELDECPKCQRPMQFFNYRAYDLELDFCDQEHGVWLDAGEEKRVLELMEQRIKDLVTVGPPRT